MKETEKKNEESGMDGWNKNERDERSTEKVSEEDQKGRMRGKKKLKRTGRQTEKEKNTRKK